MSEGDLSQRRYTRARFWAKALRWTLGVFSVLVILLWWYDMYVKYAEGSGLPISPNPNPSILRQSEITTVALFTVCISFLALVVSAIGTTSSVLLGWRADRRQAEADRRQAEEFKLKIQQLGIYGRDRHATVLAADRCRPLR